MPKPAETRHVSVKPPPYITPSKPKKRLFRGYDYFVVVYHCGANGEFINRAVAAVVFKMTSNVEDVILAAAACVILCRRRVKSKRGFWVRPSLRAR
nr:unnamed protein product [Callosobruchus analis]